MATAIDNAVESEDLKALPSTRAEALAIGALRYFTGKPCRKGHISIRSIPANGSCMACSNERQVRRRAENPERVRAINEASRQRHLDKDLAYKRKHRIDNLDRYKEWDRQRYLRKTPEDREKDHARAKEWRDNNPERVREIARQTYRNNPKHYLKKSKAWRVRNPERWKKMQSDWRRANPERISQLNAKRRALDANADGKLTPADVRRITATQKGRCACCKKKRRLSVDHIIPLSKGGTNWPNNIQMLCRPCNSAKHDIDPITFMQGRGYLL